MISSSPIGRGWDKCPSCGGPADNGNDRCVPPNAYDCTKCEARYKEEEKDIAEFHSTTQKKECCDRCLIVLVMDSTDEKLRPVKPYCGVPDCPWCHKKEIAKETIKNTPSLTGSDPNLLKNTPTTLSRIDEVLKFAVNEFHLATLITGDRNLGFQKHEDNKRIFKEKISTLVATLLSDIESNCRSKGCNCSHDI